MRKPAHFVMGFLLFFLVLNGRLVAQSPDCPDRDGLLSSSDPIYLSAMDLARRLEAHGFSVLCIFHTPLQTMFQTKELDTVSSTIAGEANLHTNFGDVEAFFLPKTQNFEELRITERRSHGQYVYTFKGNPRVQPGFRVETTGRDYYLRYDNVLLVVSSIELRARLQDSLDLRHKH